MVDRSETRGLNIRRLAVDVLSAYVANNPVPVSKLPALIFDVYTAIAEVSAGAFVAAEPVAEVERPTAVQIRKSVGQEGIVSFIDGKTYRTLKRHLTAYGLTPRSYCERFGLPTDYPMVAPGYAAQRSALAKQIGLGRPGAQAERRAGRKVA